MLADIVLNRGEEHEVVKALRHAGVAVRGKEFCCLDGVRVSGSVQPSSQPRI